MTTVRFGMISPRPFTRCCTVAARSSRSDKRRHAFFAVCRIFESGRCWDRTSDLCRAKAERWFAGVQKYLQNDVFPLSMPRVCSPLFVWVSVLLVYWLLHDRASERGVLRTSPVGLA